MTENIPADTYPLPDGTQYDGNYKEPEPADGTPAEQGDDIAVDEHGNELDDQAAEFVGEA